MGTLSQQITISDLQGLRSVTMEAQVDTGSTYLALPRDILEGLGVAATEQRRFHLADGRRVEMPVAEVSLRLDSRQLTVLCVFAPEGSVPLLGAVPLETFGLAVDPVEKRLVPVEGLLLTMGARQAPLDKARRP